MDTEGFQVDDSPIMKEPLLGVTSMEKVIGKITQLHYQENFLNEQTTM